FVQTCLATALRPSLTRILVGDSADKGQSEHTVNQAFLKNQMFGERGVALDKALQPTANPLRSLSVAELGR
ncbi:MAG: hypothetical protein OXQ84_13440, partial [bacterium]|nr:hypothetical protein [bacterium]